MYKKIFMGIAAVAALTLVSCSSDDLNSLSDNSSKNEAISFDGYLGRSAVAVNGSRGSVETKNQLKTDGFGVFGNYNSTGGQNFGSNLFNNEQVTSSSSTEPVTWTYTNTKYWPSKGHIDFLAYAPYDSEYKSKVTNDNQKLDFTVNSNIKDQKDLLWANATNQTMSNKTVTFTFKHALSRLGYTVKLNKEYTGTTITLNKITLAGSDDGTKDVFYSAGSIDLSKTSSTGLWTNLNSETKQKFDWDLTNKTLSTTLTKNDDTEYLFVIPQDFSQKTTSADALYVVVDYTITYSDQTTMNTKVYQQLKQEFEQGKAYTINLTIGLTPIEFDADVTPWTDTNNKNTDINIDSWN